LESAATCATPCPAGPPEPVEQTVAESIGYGQVAVEIRRGFGRSRRRRVPQAEFAAFRSRYQATVRASPSSQETAGS